MLPTPLAWARKILKILKSNLSPNQIAFGFALGILAGLPPMGLHVIIPSSLALLARCSFRAFLVSMGLFKMISLGIAPAAHAIGKWCLDANRGLDAMWRWLFQLPVLAPMGYGRYLLFGSLIVAVLIAIPVFLLVRYLVLRYRVSLSDRVSEWTISKRLRAMRSITLARRLLTGGEAKYAVTTPPHGLFRYVRREMLIGLPIVYAVCYLLAALIVPLFAGTIATSTASWVVGADVTVQESAFNLLTGDLTLDDLHVQDPNEPDENLIEIPRLTLDAGMLPLLSKRVVFNRVAIADVSLHVKREIDGTLNIDNTASGWNADGYLAWASEHARRVDWLGLLRKLFEHMGDFRPLALRSDPYAPHRGGRSFPPFHPAFSIERLEIGRVLISLEDDFEPIGTSPLPPITLIEVELTNLAFPVDLRDGPVVVRLHGQWGDDPQSGFELSALLDASGRTYTLSVTRLDLPRLVRFYATTLPAGIESGSLSLVGTLRQHGATATGTVSFLLENLHIRGDPQQPLFGLPAETSSRVVDGINHYAEKLPIVFGSTISGSSDKPELEWEAPLLKIAREGLLMAGRREFETTIDQLGVQIANLGGITDIPLPEAYETLSVETESAARQLIEAAGSDLTHKLTTPGSERESASSDDPASLVKNLLERLFDAPRQSGDDTETDPQ